MAIFLIIVYIAILGYTLYALQRQNQRAMHMEEELKLDYQQTERKRVEKSGEGCPPANR
ncbi:MAG TPA: hypothetical protein PKA10_12530 [Selenomonadales bacterium]|nr:hypothetical protein [Selenomonadales bacterium]